MTHDQRTVFSWYVNLPWEKWYHIGLRGWIKSSRKSDILMAALLRASAGDSLKAARLISLIGYPEWMEGTLRNGILYYKFHRRSDLSTIDHYVMFVTKNGTLTPNCGTNRLLDFQPSSGRRKQSCWGGMRSSPGYRVVLAKTRNPKSLSVAVLAVNVDPDKITSRR